MIAEVAATATACLTAIAGGTASAAGEEVFAQGKRLVTFLRERLRGDAKEALADLRTEPTPGTAATFRHELERSLAVDPALLVGLRDLLAAMPEAVRHAAQIAKVDGDGNDTFQIQGSGNVIQRR